MEALHTGTRRRKGGILEGREGQAEGLELESRGQEAGRKKMTAMILSLSFRGFRLFVC